ncbi:MAG: efflux RND transporter periplasmic adaptor subunit [Arcobacteraceae bacterium]|nr:efflux RND transporter periplasmic adaptor subunit [Arcobacteraceae bacterium]MDY0327696.1 efflux RND transporter periplasmic adaptor subunit [Arcobacteraceae bacterium]
MKKILICLFFAYCVLQADNELTARAIIKSQEQTVLSTQIAGEVVFLPKSEGEKFKKGELLAKIDCKIYEAQKAKVEIETNIAKLQMEKNKELEAYQSISKFDVLISEQEYQKRKQELNIANINVSRCQIHAPYEGYISQRYVSPYKNVEVNEKLFEIVPMYSFEAYIVVPSSSLNWIKENTNITLTIDELAQNIEAKIKFVSSVVDPTSQTVIIRAKITSKNNNIMPGMSATAYFKQPK